MTQRTQISDWSPLICVLCVICGQILFFGLRSVRPPAKPSSNIDSREADRTPARDEHAEPLLHPVIHHRAVVRRITARNLELLARREHLLDGAFPADRVAHPPSCR